MATTTVYTYLVRTLGIPDTEFAVDATRVGVVRATRIHGLDPEQATATCRRIHDRVREHDAALKAR